MTSPVNCYKSFIYNVIPRTGTKKTTQRDTIEIKKKYYRLLKMEFHKMFRKPICSWGKENRKKEKETEQIENKNKVADLRANVSIITLNANGLNTSIKR